jgi:hypothetical protein
MKSFSTKFFITVTLLHMLGTVLLIDAGFAALRAEKQSMNTQQPEPSFVWLSVWAWIWQPVPKLVLYYDHHHPHPVMETQEWKGGGWEAGAAFWFLMLPWSVFVGICFGFLVPRLSRTRSATP